MSKAFHRVIFGTVLTKILLVMLTVLQGVIVTRILGPEGRGLFSKLNASLNLFILLLGFGVTSAIVYFFSNRKILPAKVLGLSLLMLVAGIAFLCALVGLFHIAPHLDFIFPEGYRLPIYAGYLILSFAASQLQLLASAMLRAKKEFDAHNRLDVTLSALRLIVFALVFVEHQYLPVDVAAIFALDLAVSAVRSLWFWFLCRRLVGESPDFRLSWREDVKSVGQFSGLIYLSFLASFFYTRVDVWIIEYQVGLAALGQYAVAFGMAQMLTMLPVTLNTILFPHVASDSEDRGIASLAYFSRLNTAGLVLGAVLIFAAAKPFITLLYGAEFAGAILPLQILCWATVLLSVKHLFTYYNVARGKIWLNFGAEILGLTVAVVLNLWWVPDYGIVGAAWAALIANFCAGVLVVSLALRQRPEPWRDFFVPRLEDLAAFVHDRQAWWPLAPAQHIVRLDDACPTFVRENWCRLEAILDRHGIKPIVGVIPDNADPGLAFRAADPKFWDLVREWQAKGWHIAMHGHRHELKNIHRRAGYVPLYPLSEFASHSEYEQRQKVREAWLVFERERVKPTVWMAPAHSFDRTTLTVLAEETSLRVISDGLGLFPYHKNGFLWLPQQTWTLKKRALGVWTTCLHPNSMTESDFAVFERRLIQHQGRVVSDLTEMQKRFGARAESLFDRIFGQLFLLRLKLLRLRAALSRDH